MTKYFMVVTEQERAEYRELAQQGMLGPMGQGMMGSRDDEVGRKAYVPSWWGSQTLSSAQAVP